MTNTKILYVSHAIGDEKLGRYLAAQSVDTRCRYEFDLSAEGDGALVEGWQVGVQVRVQRCDGVIAFVTALSPGCPHQNWEVKCALEERKPLRGIWHYPNDRTEFPEIISCAWSDAAIREFINAL